MDNRDELETFLTKNEENDRNNRIKKTISFIKQNDLKKTNLSSLYRSYYYKGFYEYFINKNIKEAKQCFYLSSKSFNIYINDFDGEIQNIQMCLAVLLSDNIDLIKQYANIKTSRYESIREGSNPHILLFQSIINDDYEESKYLLTKFIDNKSINIKLNVDFFNALIDGNIEKMQQSIYSMLEPKEHKKRTKHFIIESCSEPVLLYAKLAYIKGFELDIDHSLIPKELLPVKPNDEYWEYDFMKEEEYKDV